MRTHARADSEGGGSSGYDDDSIVIGGVGGGAESEEVDELDEGGYDVQVYPNGVRGLQTPDIKMCEVELSGSVHDVPGDEEGLVAAPGSEYVRGSYFPMNTTATTTTTTTAQVDPYGSSNGHHQNHHHHWPGALQLQQPTMAQLHRSHTPLPSSPAGYLRHAPIYGNGGGGGGGGGSESEFVTSISAPAHKQMFDHAALYPPSLGLMEPSSSSSSSSSGPGPIRRHRSMTPSLIKGETLRRPMTATSGDYSSSSRGYHPYAIHGYGGAGAHTNSSSSAQSSPASYPVQLDYTSSRPGSTHRSGSAGQQLQDQMHHMLNLDQMDDGLFAESAGVAAVTAVSGHQGYEEMYRTESPLPFTTTALPGSAPASYSSSHFTPSLSEGHPDQFAHQVDGYFSSVSQSHHPISM
jgi:transcription factor STE12